MSKLQVLNAGLEEIQSHKLSKISVGFIPKYEMEKYRFFVCADEVCYGVMKVTKNSIGGEIWQMERVNFKIHL